MANILPILLSLFILQTLKAAPSDDPAISKISEENPKLDSVSTGVADKGIIENDGENNQRKKRYYDYGGFGYSQPAFPTNFPYPFQTHYSKRDQSHNIGVYGAEDAFSQIFRRLQEIVSDIRRYPQSVPQPTIPAFIPFLYIPQVDCGCSSTTTSSSKVPSKPPNNNDQPQTNPDKNVPDLPDRFLEIDDSRRNWGIVVNSSEPELSANIEGDGNRPISFDPVIPQTPIDVPVPPVEHGSVQAGAQPQPITTTTFAPIASKPMANRPAQKLRPQGSSRIPSIAPTNCDTAVITCCFRPQVTPNCFAEQGCPDTSIYGKPCNPNVVLNVVNKFKHFVEQKTSLSEKNT